MDSFLPSKLELSSWKTKVTAAVAQQEMRGLATLFKPAALVAASSSRVDLIETWLSNLSDEVIECDPQILYWSGVTMIMKRPAEAQPRLERAFELFAHGANETWSLLAWAGIVDCIFLRYRDLRELDPWITWMTASREAAVDRLPSMPSKLVVASMLFALAFRQPDHPQMTAWRDRAERLIEIDPASDLGARLSSGLVIDYIWRGNLAAAELVQKRFAAYASRRKLSPRATVLNHLNEATLSLHQGRLDQCRQAIARGLDAAIELDIRLWDGIFRCHAIAVSCSRNEATGTEEHFAAIEGLLAEGVQVDEAYYRGMLFWNAFVAGDWVGAVSRCANAIEFADSKGVPYLQAVGRIGAGLTLFQAGHREQGMSMLDEGLQISRNATHPSNDLLEWIGGLFRAHMAFANGDDAVGNAALKAAMQLGCDQSLMHTFFWPRQIITDLIDRALRHNYSTAYARQLINLHALVPTTVPARSDRWDFDVRIYTLGEPRIEFLDGRIEPLSIQFQRQIELLAALIGKAGRASPLHVVASNVYQHDDVEAVGSIKRILHSLRERIGPVIHQRNGALSIDFGKVWIDACSLQRLLKEANNSIEIAAWLDQYYRGHFMDCVENSAVVLGVRRQLCHQVEFVLRGVMADQAKSGMDDAQRRLTARWSHLFPTVRHTC